MFLLDRRTIGRVRTGFWSFVVTGVGSRGVGIVNINALSFVIILLLAILTIATAFFCANLSYMRDRY